MITIMSDDHSELLTWVNAQLPTLAVQPHSIASFTALAGDAGFRQYYQVDTQPPLLAVMAPQTNGVSESATYFAELSNILRRQGVATPEIMACDEKHNYLLIEHFGTQSLLSVLSKDNVDGLYAQALMMLLNIQQVPRRVVSVPSYDRTLLCREMALLREWFVTQLLPYTLSVSEHVILDELFEYLASQAVEQPQVLVHRDYHSRNLMYRPQAVPGVIDFQDAVWGPVTYDAVSLLKDCYIRWSPDQVRKWALGYANMAYELGIIPAVSESQFIQWFDLMGLQRHLKVLGIFARLSLRDGKVAYLQDLPLVIRYVLEVSEQYPETQAFAAWFKERLLPLVEQQSWYSPVFTAGDR